MPQGLYCAEEVQRLSLAYAVTLAWRFNKELVFFTKRFNHTTHKRVIMSTIPSHTGLYSERSTEMERDYEEAVRTKEWRKKRPEKTLGTE